MSTAVLTLDPILQDLSPRDVKEKIIKYIENLPSGELRSRIVDNGIFEYSTHILILTSYFFNSTFYTSTDRVLIVDLEFYESLFDKLFSREAQKVFQKIIPIDLKNVLNVSNNEVAIVYDIKNSSIIGFVKLIWNWNN